MQLFRFSTTAVLVATLLLFIGFGCDQPTAQKQPSAAPTAVKPTAQANSDASEANEESAKPKPESILNVRDLVTSAAKAISHNDTESAIRSLNRARELNNGSLPAKFEIAKLLFGAGKMASAVEVYDEILELRPELKPELWQRGLALYYADQFEEGVEQFETHQNYNSQDVENSVWHMLCKARLTSVEEARETMIEISHDQRVPMKEIFNMFAGTGSPDKVIKASGYDAEKVTRKSTTYHGWLYIGLFHEMMGDGDAASKAMQKALECKPYIPSLMGYVADGHLRVRGTYPEPSEP